MIEPVSLADIKAHLRLELGETGEDEYLNALITAARRACELRLNRALTQGSLTLTLDRFPAARVGMSAALDRLNYWIGGDGQRYDPTIYLAGGDVASVESIAYRDPAGIDQVLASADYVVDLTRTPARISPATFWPAAARTAGSVVVTYTAAALAPDETVMVSHAIRLLVGSWYANREADAVDVRGAPVELPMSVSWLLAPLRQIATP